MRAKCVHFGSRVDLGTLHGIRCGAGGRISTYPMANARARDALYARCCVGGARCPIRETGRAGIDDVALIRLIASARRRKANV